MGKATIIEAQNSNAVYEDGKSKGILGKLKGVFADYKNGTRNADRLYTEELWDNRVFGSEDVMEALETKTLFGELDHPEGDRCETLAKNAAISIVKLEKRPDEGVIYGEAEILDTPTGRILKTLADSGAKLGISSRGMGEEIFSEGKNIIDPETYDFITFDVVVTPANTKARVALTESKQLSVLTESFKKEIAESETINQLSQVKTALENVTTADKEELIGLVESKIDSLTPKAPNKFEEVNKDIVLKKLKAKYEEFKVQVNEMQSANSALMTENVKLAEENEFFKSSRDTMKSRIKEDKELASSSKAELEESKKEVTELTKQLEESNNKVTELEAKLKESKTALEESKKEVEEIKEAKKVEETKHIDETILKLKEIQNRKLEGIEASHKEEIAKLEESKVSLENRFNTLMEANKQLSKNLSASAKVLNENKELQKQVEQLKMERENSKKSLQESKLAENTKVTKLEAKIKELTAKLQEKESIEEKFSKLAFTPMGTVTALTENFKQTDYSDDEIDLFNVLTNK